jgi:actin-related protein 5
LYSVQFSVSFKAHVKKRIEAELRAGLPAGTVFAVTMASDPVLDAWSGASAWAAHGGVDAHGITAADYREKGADFLKEHVASNLFVRPLSEAPL